MSDSPTEKKVAEKKESLRLPSLEDVREWEGYRVDEVSGHSVALVEGFFVDQEPPRRAGYGCPMTAKSSVTRPQSIPRCRSTRSRSASCSIITGSPRTSGAEPRSPAARMARSRRRPPPPDRQAGFKSRFRQYAGYV